VPVQELERTLMEAEKRELEARIRRLQSIVRFSLPKAAAASLIVCGTLAALTLFVSDAPRAVIVGFWVALAVLFTLWIGLPGRTGLRRQAIALEAALQHDRARVFRVQSTRVVEFEEIEDEGACYAFDISDGLPAGALAKAGRVLFVLGQEFYAGDDFPNSDFSLATVLGPGNAIVDEIFTKTGAKLEPERRIARDVKDRLTIPDHLEVIEADLTTIESALPPAAIHASGRRPDRP
jgi:hypothetical protein